MTLSVHASCVALGGRGVLLAGRSGSGKSDLTLRLMDRGAVLVSDDYTLLRIEGGRLVAGPPATIAGMVEVRGIGIVERPFVRDMPICLMAELDAEVPRMPDRGAVREIEGVAIPLLALNALEASAPIKLEIALDLIGLKR